MRIVYAGSPAIAVPALEALAAMALEDPGVLGAPGVPGAPGEASGDVSGGFELAALLTNPDSPRGRHGKPEPTDAAAAVSALGPRFAAARRDPPVLLKPEKLGAAVRGELETLKPDLLVSFAYGRIFGPKFLALLPLGGINIHPSLLPAYRGPAPIPQAILNGDRETGISIQRLALQMDCGDILAQERFPLTGRETGAALAEEMARRAARLLPSVIRGLAAGTLQGRPQNREGASYCGLLSRDDGKIDWGQSARRIEAQVRAYTPWPLSWTVDGERRLCILGAALEDVGGLGAGALGLAQGPDIEPGDGPAAGSGRAAPGTVLGVDKERGILVQTGDGVLVLTVLQYQAKKALEWRSFLNGARDFIGRRLGQGEGAGGNPD
ncbi:MAG: methionyl-tRNA formyltransferase [Treponema sp.]|jgi:methionyl-tRNA formyltransferase|nr:methionyl-tRNA formyltransferase [Treponema sp.]